MSKKNIFLLAAWYIAGGIVASIYSKKKPEELKTELESAKESGKWSFKVIMDNFVDTHANMIDNLKKNYLVKKIKLFLMNTKKK